MSKMKKLAMAIGTILLIAFQLLNDEKIQAWMGTVAGILVIYSVIPDSKVIFEKVKSRFIKFRKIKWDKSCDGLCEECEEMCK